MIGHQRVPRHLDRVQRSSVRQPEQEVRPGAPNGGIGVHPPGDGRARGVEVDPPLRRSVGGGEVEGPAEAFDPLLGQETGEELDDELLEPGSGHHSVQGIRSQAAISHRVLGIPAMDRHLDGETPAPPGHPSVAGRRSKRTRPKMSRPSGGRATPVATREPGSDPVEVSECGLDAGEESEDGSQAECWASSRLTTGNENPEISALSQTNGDLDR